jgi:hypothetical protein
MKSKEFSTTFLVIFEKLVEIECLFGSRAIEQQGKPYLKLEEGLVPGHLCPFIS